MATPGVRLTLVVILFLTVCGLLLTHYFVGLHRATEADLAQRWFVRGNAAMQAGNPGAAADNFRTALSYDRDNRQYRLRLSEALLTANHFNEARAYLIGLWETEPANGEVNLQLARLYVRRNLPAESVRYYRNAINGTWNEGALDQRVATRFELVNYLMQQHDMGQAAAELLALQADQPRSVADQLRLASLLLAVNEPEHARDVYAHVLEDDPENPAALLGQGVAFLELSDYRGAEQALTGAVEHNPASQEARRRLALVREILRISPALRGLSLTERSRRAAEAFKTAFERLTGCSEKLGYKLAVPNEPSQSGLPAAEDSTAGAATAGQSSTPDDVQLLYNSGVEKRAAATEKTLEKNPDALEPTMQYVFEVEKATAPLCSDMSETDRALLFLAQHQGESMR